MDAGFSAPTPLSSTPSTALIATALLFMFGSGPVRGFAVTMGLGIAISMFTAVSIVRVIMVAIVNRWKLKVLRIEPLFHMKLVPEGTKISFMNARHFGIAFSAVLSIASIALFIYPGLNYGVDFRGGIQMEVVTSGPADLAPMRASLEALGLGEIALQEYGEASRVLVRAERQPGGEEAQSAAIAKIRAAMSALDSGATIERTEVVGPKVIGGSPMPACCRDPRELRELLYIWFRFDTVGWGRSRPDPDGDQCASVSCAHGLEFNLTAIAPLDAHAIR